MLTGYQVVLRAPTAADIGVLHEIASDLDSWEERSPRPPRPVSREEYAERFAASLTEPGLWFVIESAGRAIGRCDLFGIDELARHGEVGIALHRTARGQGHGTDAMRVLVRFAFERRNLRRVHLRSIASNAAALASYRRVGFVEEGRYRESAWIRGHFEDEVLMGLLRSEWAG